MGSIRQPGISGSGLERNLSKQIDNIRQRIESLERGVQDSPVTQAQIDALKAQITILASKITSASTPTPTPSDTEAYFASGAVLAYAAVHKVADQSYAQCDSGTLTTAFGVAGIALTAGADLDSILVARSFDLVTNGSFTWTAFQPVFVGPAGTITQTPPESGYVLEVAYALSATVLLVGIKVPILVSAITPGVENALSLESGELVRRPLTVARVTGAAPLDSPLFAGDPRAPTASPGDNDTTLANTAFVTAAVAAATVGLWDDRGNYDASTNLFPSSGGSGLLGAILKGDIWTISVAGVLGGTAVALGDTVRALIDAPGNLAANWALGEHDLGYAPVNRAGDTMSGALNWAPLITVASAGTTNIGAAASNELTISGTTTITALGTIASGAKREVTFSGILTLTHNATSLILPGATNITTAVGDVAEFLSLGSGNWRCVKYQKANGTALVSSASITYTRGASFENGGNVLVAADANIVYVRSPIAGTITRWSITGDNVIGSCQFDILKGTSYPPTASIVASAPPLLVTSKANTSSTLTGWTTAVAVGDWIGFQLVSSSLFLFRNIEIEITT